MAQARAKNPSRGLTDLVTTSDPGPQAAQPGGVCLPIAHCLLLIAYCSGTSLLWHVAPVVPVVPLNAFINLFDVVVGGNVN